MYIYFNELFSLNLCAVLVSKEVDAMNREQFWVGKSMNHARVGEGWLKSYIQSANWPLKNCELAIYRM